MVNNKRLCISCSIAMKKIHIKHKGVKLEALQCPKCKEKIFTEDLTMKAIAKLEARRLKKEYIKNPIRIGHSWGMTFPKDVTECFNLDSSKTKLKVHPNLEKRTIELNL